MIFTRHASLIRYISAISTKASVRNMTSVHISFDSNSKVFKKQMSIYYSRFQLLLCFFIFSPTLVKSGKRWLEDQPCLISSLANPVFGGTGERWARVPKVLLVSQGRQVKFVADPPVCHKKKDGKCESKKCIECMNTFQSKLKYITLIWSCRSGSSILGKLLSIGPRTIYLYEPLRAIGKGQIASPKRKAGILQELFKCNVVRLYDNS